MKQQHHEPYEQADPSSPLLAHAASRIAFGDNARDISDFAAALVPTFSDAYAHPGEFVTQARQLRKMTVFLMSWAVLLERDRGASWSEIAAACGQDETWVRARWQPAEIRWLAMRRGEVDPPENLEELLELPPGDLIIDEADIRKEAELLDAWCARRAAAADLTVDDSPEARRPVSDGIREH